MYITYVHCRLGITSPDEFFDIGQEYIHIQPGTINVIRVKPSQLVSTDDIKSVSIAARNCRFEDEIPENMTMFQSYLRKACLFDCMFQYLIVYYIQWRRSQGCRGCNCSPSFQKLSHKNAIKPMNFEF